MPGLPWVPSLPVSLTSSAFIVGHVPNVHASNLAICQLVVQQESRRHSCWVQMFWWSHAVWAIHNLQRGVVFVASVLTRIVWRVHAVLHASNLTLQWLLEDSAHVLGYEALVFLLVTLSLLSLNILSLLYISFAGCGMFFKARSADALPRILAPILTFMLLVQYAFLMPSLTPEDPVSRRDELHSWLALAPTTASVSCLLLAVCVSVSQVHTGAWRAHGGSEHRSRANNSPMRSSAIDEPLMPQPSSDTHMPALHRLYYLTQDLQSLPSSYMIVLDGADARIARHDDDSIDACTLRLTCSARWGLRRSMSIHGRSSWGWPDHLHFWLLRFSLDALMIFVVALCCVERDLIHAAYLALTLFLFRRREELRLRGNGLFIWMQLANFCVIVAMLLFQTPWAALWARPNEGGLAGLCERHRGSREGGDSGEGCTVAHLLGLHRIAHAGSWRALGLAPRGAGLPLLMWLAVQVRCTSLSVDRAMPPQCAARGCMPLSSRDPCLGLCAVGPCAPQTPWHVHADAVQAVGGAGIL
jgi:hypothetical protein